ncbi:MAG: NAD(P)-dependent oxidoreductase [Alphaproteobacteria bacterium]
MKIGYIGLGNMGRPIAANLARAGHEMIVFDLSREAVDCFVEEFDARPANGLESLAQAADIIITIVPSGQDVRKIVLGEKNGDDCLLAGLDDSKLFIDMSSSEPTGTVNLGETLKEHGISFIDAPVSGGVKRAAAGTISIMVGGEKASIERAQPLFQDIGDDVFECGELGAGHALKALNNMLSALSVFATTEALMIGKRFGLDPAVMIDTINKSSGRSNATELKFHQFILNKDYGSGFSNGLMLKDLTIAQDLARSTGLSAPCTALVRDAFAEAVNHYGPTSDHTEVARMLQEIRKTAL